MSSGAGSHRCLRNDAVPLVASTCSNFFRCQGLLNRPLTLACAQIAPRWRSPIRDSGNRPGPGLHFWVLVFERVDVRGLYNTGTTIPATTTSCNVVGVVRVAVLPPDRTSDLRSH